MGEMRRLYYQTKENQYPSFKRYMFRWDGIVSGNVFQLSRLMIDDVDLPYTYVNWGASGGSTISTQPATAMIASTSSYASPNSKWCRSSVSSSSYGWLIFDLPDTHEIHSYRVMSGDDTASNTGRNPSRIRLYGTTSEATTVSDESWVLLSDVSNSGNSKIPTANRTWSSYFAVEPEEVVTGTYYLLAPSDISRGSGLRTEMPEYSVLYSRAEQFTYGTYPGGTIPWSEHNVILFKFNAWITGSDARMSLAVNPPNDTWRVGIRRNDSKFGSNKFAVEKGTFGWFSSVTIDDSSVVESSAWGGGVIFYTIPATTSSDTNEFRIIVDRVNNTVYFYLNGVLKFHQTGFSDYENTMYMFPESNSTFMKDAYIVGCNSLQDALFYGTFE